MLERIQVVPDIAGLSSVDGVVAAHGAVVAGEPFGAALFEDNATGNDVLAAGALCAQTLSSGIAGVSVGRSLGGVRGVTHLGE